MNLHDSIETLLNEKGRTVHTIEAGATILEALKLMADKGIGALTVMEEERLVGVFSERDYARKVVLAGRSSRTAKVSEAMSGNVVTVGNATKVDECMKLMTKKRIRHLPVVEGGSVVGMVSIGDLVNWIMKAQEQTIHDLEDYISGDYPH